MATIEEIKQQYPDLNGLDDDQVVGALHKAFYADLPREQVAKSLGVKTAPPAADPNAPGQMRSGFNRSFAEVPGLAAGSAAYVADVVGADETRDKLLDYAKKSSEKVQAAHQGDAASITDAWDGKTSWPDFLKNATGYVAGQALQGIATGGLGALGGKMLATQGIKAVAERTAAEFIAKGATQEVATAAAASAAKNYAAKMAIRGAVVGAGGQNLNMELGSIYPDAVDEATSQGRTLDGGDKFRVGASALAAAGVDTAAEAITANRVFRGSRVGQGAAKPSTVLGSEMLGRAVREVPAGMVRESGTEGVQTAIEHYGAGQPIADENGTRDIIDSMGVGAVGGILGGAGASFHSRKVEEVGPLSRAANAGTDTAVPPPASPALQIGNTPDPYLSFADGTVARKSEIDAYINSLPPEQQPAARAKVMGLAPQPSIPQVEPATPAEAMGIDPTAGPLSSAAAISVNTGTTQEIQRNEANAADQAAYDEEVAAQEQQAEQQAQQQDSAVNPITTGPIAEAAMSPEDKRAILFSNQPVVDGGVRYTGTQDGDILNGLGKPYATRMAAQRRVTMEGKDWMVAPVFDGFVARRKDATNGTTDATAAVDQGADAGAGHQPTGSGTNSLAKPVPGTDGAGSLPAAPGGRGEPDHAVVDAGDSAVAIAGASHVQDPTPAAQPAPAQAAGETPPAVAGDATATEGLPGAASAAVEADGVADYSKKWFGSQDKAQTFIDTQGIGQTHAVAKQGKRWIVAASNTALAPVSTEKEATNSIATVSQPEGSNHGTQADQTQPQQTQQQKAPERAAGKQVAPKLTARARIEQAKQARSDYFTPGNIVKGYSGHDEVLSYTPSAGDGSGWSVKVRAVVKEGGKWVPDPKDTRERSHATQPDVRELKAGPVERVEPAPAAQVPHTEPRADGKSFPNAVARGIEPSNQGKPRLGESANDVYAEFKKLAAGYVSTHNGIVPVTAHHPAGGPSYTIGATGDLEVLTADGVGVRKATEAEKQEFHNDLESDYLQIRAMTRPGFGSGYKNQRVVAELHSPSGNSFAKSRQPVPAEPDKKPAETTAESFIKAPDGSMDFGEITPEMSKAMRRQAGKIRLQQGNDSFGLQHIEKRHGGEIQSAGFDSITDFVSDVAKNMDEIWLPGKTSQLIAVHSVKNDRVMFIQLQEAKDEDGDFYTVNTAFPSRSGFAEKKSEWKKLWEGRAQPSQPADSKQAPFAESPLSADKATTIPSGQSDASVVQDGQEIKLEPAQSSAQPAATPEPADVLDAETALWSRITDGTATVDEFKAGFERWVSSKADILAALAKNKKDDLLKMGGSMFAYRNKSETKSVIVESLWRDGANQYVLARSFSHGLGKNAWLDGVRNMVEATDAAQLAQYAKDRKSAQEEAVARVSKVADAIKDPQALEDFHALIRATKSTGKTFKEARMMLTPEQRARYDDLTAIASRAERSTRKEAQQDAILRAPGESVTATEIIKTRHTKHGHDLWQFNLDQRVSGEEFKSLVAQAKRLGGDYSSYRGNGAIPGWQFRTEDAAKAFKTLIAGDASAAKDVMQERRDAFVDDRSQSATERLNEMADRLDERADASLNQERKANTDKRARQAASAEAAANAEKAMAKTMRNIAQAITDDRAKFLDRVRQKAQVEALQGYVTTAKGEELRARYASYGEQEKHRGEAPTAETADFAEFPTFSAYRSDLATLARQLLEVDGTKLLGQRLLKEADDVSDAYTAFAKENFGKVSAFSSRGGVASFGTKADAEAAIARSGYKGKAIAYQVKRGKHAVILSPSEAIERGIWQGDGDKRLTLAPDTGVELVEKIGKAARRGAKVSVPWQLETAHDRRKALARMGIETPAEFRAALREFIALQEQAEAPSKVKQLERAMVGRSNDGLDFFPTPESVADEMVSAAGVEPGMSVLEPSAGWGHIAERIRAAGVDADVVEMSGDRRELLEAKGFNVVANDFTALNLVDLPDGAGYDRIIMNPPFSDGRDIQHVQHAYTLLKPGGRIVAIMGESAFTNQSKKASEFRTWLESVGGTEEKLAEGSFNDPSLPVNTGANARMVVIERGESEPIFSRSTDTVNPGGQPAARVQSLVNAIAARWKNAPKAVVVQSLDDPRVPEKVRDEGKKLKSDLTAIRSNDSAGAPDGFFDKGTGTVYLIADKMAGDIDVVRVLMHESLGHYGLRGLYGAQLGTILDRIAVLNSAKVKNAAKRLGLDFEKPSERRMATEEVLAYMAQEMPELGWVKRAVAAVRAWLRQHIPGFGKMQLSDDELIRDYIIPARQFVEDGSRQDGKNVTGEAGTPFSRAAIKPEAAALEQLSQNDELFALPKSDKTTVEGIAADTDPGITVKKLNHPGLVQTYMLTMPDGGKARMMVRAVNPYGPQAYGMVASEDGETSKPLTERPGLNAESLPDDVESVYIDVSTLKEGGQGKFIYNIAATYAHNTGRIMIGDPAGLSDIAMRRRTENMLSSALKFGTTRHLAPHPRQMDGAYGIGVPPLHWTYGDDLGNITSLIQTSLKSFKNAVSDPITFDPKDGTFRNSEGGILDDGAIQLIADKPGSPRPGNAGSATYKRSAILSALLREQSQEGGAGRQGVGILGRILEIGREFPAPSKGILYSRNLGDALTSAANNVRDVNLPAGYKVSDLINSAPGKLNWWHKSVGTQYNLAQRSAPFKKVYDSVQNFINDVSYYATEAADLAPTILPKLETLKDIGKSPLSAEDTKAVSAPVFEGTLTWARDESGQPVKVEALEHNAVNLSTEQKASRLLRNDHISASLLKMWQGLDINQYEILISNKYERDMLKPGVVWTPAELKRIFKLNDKQVGLYQEFRKATDKSLTNLAIADMLRFGGDDVIPLREAALDAKTPAEAATMLADYLRTLTDLNPQRREVLLDTADKMIEKGDKASDLMARGYAPLSRFGQYTLDVVHNGERVYFGLFENKWEAAKMNRKMAVMFPGAAINQGTVSEQAYKMFAGVSPETLELFGDMLGLEGSGDGAANAAFQTYLKLARSNRSAMKRLIQRKGIAGFSEDAGRVLAGFVYSNARQTASSLHMGDMTRAAADKQAFGHNGELQDAATKLVDYIKNPQEEAQAFRGLMFAQYIGGSVASALVNMTQPLTMTFPWLTQYGTIADVAKQMVNATKDANRKITGDARLDAALHKAEEDGTVSPQEVHQLMQQAMGSGVLRSGDGTTAGNTLATAQNTLSRISLAWGKMFSTAEQFNRRVTFIAAYRTAVQAKMADPDAFARKAIAETQGVYNRGNKPQWARGALGSTLFTFKQYSISYVEMLSRMAKNGPQGRKAALLALAVMFVLSGASGLPGSDDLDDIISGALQAMGYNFDSKQKRKEFFVSLIGDGGADFMERGISGLPGVPVDVSGRLGIGNLIPGTGLFTKKTDHTRDVAEFAGVAGDFINRGFNTASKVIKGDIGGVHGAVATMAPKAAQNLFQAYDMANTGMYRDQTGKKVIDTDAGDALSKALGLQPNDVKRVQDAAGDAMRMIGLNRIRESEIAGEWAAGLFEKDQAKVQAAREDLKQWNIDNPDSPIKINFRQVLLRVRKMNESKHERIAKTAPKEIRASVKRELLASQ